MRSGSFFISSKIISAVVTLLLLIFLARYLKPIDYGIYTIVIALYTLLGMGGNFGMGTALRKKLSEKEVGRERKKELISNGFAIAGIIALAIMLIGIAISGVLDLIDIPIGTIIGIVILWYFTRPEVKEYFGK